MVKLAAGKIKLIAIIASLAALALILSPTFSLLQVPGATNTQGDGFPADASFIPDDTVVEGVSKEDLVACISFDENVDQILGVRNDTVDDSKLASDTLIAEFCNRPVLIHEMMSMDNHGLSLVAYGCDASAGRIGTEAIQDSLSEYSEIYCDSVRPLILDESNTFLETVEAFRTNLPLMEAGQGEEEEAADTDTGSFNATRARVILDNIEQSLDTCIAQVHESEYYPAARSFDDATKMFIAMLEGQAEAEEQQTSEAN